MSEYALMTEEQRELTRILRSFLSKELAPLVKEYDLRGEFPMEVYKKMGDIGLWGMDIPAEYGGMGLDATTLCLLREELGKVDTGFAVTIGASTVGFKIVAAGDNEEQKRWIAQEILHNGKITAMCITEPDGGSDVASTRTRAVKDGSEYVINGTKAFITNGGIADYYVVVASTAPELRHKGISCFIVPRNTPGLSVGKEENKVGIRLSNTTEVVFEDVRVSEEYRIGVENEGFGYVMKALERSRPLTIGPVIGLAQAALDMAVQYARERVVFGRPIARNQGIRWMLADMETQITAARELMLYACRISERGLPLGPHGSAAKLYAAEMALRVTGDAQQIFGGYGYSREYPIEKLVRDARAYSIVEGTNQIQRDIIGKSIIGSLKR